RRPGGRGAGQDHARGGPAADRRAVQRPRPRAGQLRRRGTAERRRDGATAAGPLPPAGTSFPADGRPEGQTPWTPSGPVTTPPAVGIMNGNHRLETAMPGTQPRRTPEELARLGSEVFDRHVRPMLRPEDDGKFVAIDVDTGDHEIDEDDYAAVTRLR